jgi:hypothetical protein
MRNLDQKELLYSKQEAMQKGVKEQGKREVKCGI